MVAVGFKEALNEDGTFKTSIGTFKIKQIPGGTIEITELIVGERPLGGREASPSDVIKFTGSKEDAKV
ncbi:MAG: hypothetical protein LBB05_03670 [Puniceicoccales bacterium]|nr:hypothetical protein [Puniceicoccales bacterium]